jgi:hypothetical protein
MIMVIAPNKRFLDQAAKLERLESQSGANARPETAADTQG